jgi:hypothetical protein
MQPAMQERVTAGEEDARLWLAAFDELGDHLGVKCSC